MTVECRREFQVRRNEQYGLYHGLTGEEKSICHFLVDAGPLGCSFGEIARLDIAQKMKVLETLLKTGVVRKIPLWQLAQELVQNEFNVREFEDLEAQGGYLVLEAEGERWERAFFSDFDLALGIVRGEETPFFPDHSEDRFQVRPDLYRYIDMLLE